MVDKEKGSGINSPDLTDVERGIQEILEKLGRYKTEILIVLINLKG